MHQAAQQGHVQIVNSLLDNKASPNVTTNQGQTALSIAQKLGYISVVETLKVVTETIVTTTTTTITEEKYKVVAPEVMHESFMSDSEDEAGLLLLFIQYICPFLHSHPHPHHHRNKFLIKISKLFVHLLFKTNKQTKQNNNIS